MAPSFTFQYNFEKAKPQLGFIRHIFLMLSFKTNSPNKTQESMILQHSSFWSKGSLWRLSFQSQNSDRGQVESVWVVAACLVSRGWLDLLTKNFQFVNWLISNKLRAIVALIMMVIRECLIFKHILSFTRNIFASIDLCFTNIRFEVKRKKVQFYFVSSF